ncbi:hypothetical protein GCM10027589_40390 [Actinocorallia lasiicapitis]
MPGLSSSTVEVRKGTYSGTRYFWARGYPNGDAHVYRRAVSMIWRYEQNNSLYECPNYSDAPKLSYSSGVPYWAINRAQAKMTSYDISEINNIPGVRYGPAVNV